MSDVLVYSAVFGGYDVVQEPLEPGRYHLITDRRAPGGWIEQKEPPVTNPRRAARYWKTHTPQAAYTIWLDGNVQLTVEPRLLVDKWLLDTQADIALFHHPVRDCLYQEAQVCKSKRKDAPEVINAQMERYRLKGFPRHFGQGETPVVVRRNNPAVDWFNGQWWDEICPGRVRDR